MNKIKITATLVALATSAMAWSQGRVVYVYDYNAQLINTITNATALSFPEGKLVVRSNNGDHEYPLQDVGNMIVKFDITDDVKSLAADDKGVTLSVSNGVVCVSALSNIRCVDIFTPAGQVLASSQPNATVAALKVDKNATVLLVRVDLEGSSQTFKLINE